jgi:two-component system sensor histidine kinase SenX3
VSVDDILKRAIDESLTGADDKGITLIHNGQRDLSVLGNREQVAVAVSNLVSNAVAYSPEGSSVVVAARGDDTTVDIAVTDRGIGIPPTELDRIFERFYRVDPARHRSTGGTGLGLSIVKHVAASHGGDVRVWSVEGQGSTFTLTLPRNNGSFLMEDRP